MQRVRHLELALLAYGLLNATLYTGLLPLWEGFDEPFHYAYVQHLRETRSFPRLGETTLSAEVWGSILAAPASHIVQHNIPQVVDFGEYFRRPAEDRARMRERLDAIDPALSRQSSDAQNYEAHQAPLAYLLLAPLDRLWSSAPIPRRVWRLRLVCAWAAVVLCWIGVLAFATTPVWRAVAAFLVFSLQMFYASTAHICNDWLAIPLFTLFLAALSRGRWVAGFAAFCAGVLAKAYFLAAAPVAVLALWKGRKRAAWAAACALPAVAWYGRNVVLYGNVSGMQEARGGVPLSAILDAARRLPWWDALRSTAHSVLWAGNNSDISFHRRTIDATLLLLAVGAAMFLIRRKWSLGEKIGASAIGLFGAALAFSLAQSFYYTHGQQTAPSPWFVQPIYPPAICLIVSGLASSGRAGKAIGVAAVWLWTYVICATYWLKLIPLYAGYPSAKAQPARLFRWYRQEFPASLDTTALIGSGPILWLSIAVTVMAIGLAAWLTVRLTGFRAPSAS